MITADREAMLCVMPTHYSDCFVGPQDHVCHQFTGAEDVNTVSARKTFVPMLDVVSRNRSQMVVAGITVLNVLALCAPCVSVSSSGCSTVHVV